MIAATAAVALLAGGANAQDGDRHVGYYYPAPTTTEIYDARVPLLPGSDRKRRVGFVTVMTNEMLKNPYPPQFAIFAKGAEAEKLIITALGSDSYDTLFRARGLFAMLTAVARGTPFFQEQPDADRFTFFDLAKLLGFEQITYTDGADFAHQIKLR
ncbi:MAG: molybdopterin-guanine dinucleotide biosynthesis protein A [Alphaproteobacteria bacterium]